MKLITQLALLIFFVAGLTSAILNDFSACPNTATFLGSTALVSGGIAFFKLITHNN